MAISCLAISCIFLPSLSEQYPVTMGLSGKLSGNLPFKLSDKLSGKLSANYRQAIGQIIGKHGNLVKAGQA